MSVGREVYRATSLALKDLTTERRTKANFNAVVFLAGVMLLLFGFALGPDADALRNAAAGVLWLTVLFSGVQAFHRSYEVELEDGALETLLMYPGSRKAIFLGKLLANLAFVLLVEAIVVPVSAVLYNLPMTRLFPGILPVLFLGTLGFVTLGTFYGAMASRLRARDVLLPLLLFPMLIPVLVASVEATSALMVGDVMGDMSSWIGLLVAFDVIFLFAALLTFETVVEE
ncbi:MAG: heme exporter protein CcmB [Gemmatimonadota bacterium]|jgi:heme exporter protein B